MKYFRRASGLVLIIMGLAVFAYPYVSEWVSDYRIAKYVREFNETYGTGTSEAADEEGAAAADKECAGIVDKKCEALSGDADGTAEGDLLYSQCVAYNEAIYEENQSGLVDASSYEQAAIELDADEFGYIEIPAMDLVLPLYLGASEENMAKGAAVMGQTSVPVGGENTNAVIAAHRGYRGSPYFREIEKLSIGDEVYVTNRWGTLTYTATEIDIISPDDRDAITIQEGKDMVTLITCHPYRSHGKYRYVVYCERSRTDTGRTENSASGASGEADGEDSISTKTITASDGTVYELSDSDIRNEETLRRACAIIMMAVFIIALGRVAYRYVLMKEKNCA